MGSRVVLPLGPRGWGRACRVADPCEVGGGGRRALVLNSIVRTVYRYSLRR